MTQAKTATKAARQGEAFFIRVDKLPDDVTEVQATDGKHIAAHSETGHHHVINGFGVRMYQKRDNPLVAYFVADSVEYMDVVHNRSHDTHDTVRLAGGRGAVWQRNLQREWTPEGWERVAD